jgi:hypothetical protein
MVLFIIIGMTNITYICFMRGRKCRKRKLKQSAITGYLA